MPCKHLFLAITRTSLRNDRITICLHHSHISSGFDSETRLAHRHRWAVSWPSRYTKESLKTIKLLLSSRISCQRPTTTLLSPMHVQKRLYNWGLSTSRVSHSTPCASASIRPTLAASAWLVPASTSSAEGEIGLLS
jgi:hypothetical protein